MVGNEVSNSFWGFFFCRIINYIIIVFDFKEEKKIYIKYIGIYKNINLYFGLFFDFCVRDMY